ncbi:TPA: V-type ATP synthase subunit C, partial [Candidatus Poribacteria bacterium]|nr:V-type ATP synthase subunit C [Candidatus Poribacteria bacterium]HEX30202.1 V-type ATP synthase subunit C [Candidatus Poribacteria bacterium]
DYIRPAKYVAFGIEPLIAYLIAKEHEVKLIRIIMIGKINQLSMDSISERLREPYV